MSLTVNALLLFTTLGLRPGVDFLVPAPDAQVTAGELKAHVSFLASDELGGRSLGSEGLAKAAKYLAAQLKSFGLEPAGDGDSFLQAITFERDVFHALPEMTTVPSNGKATPLTYGADFRVRRGGTSGRRTVMLLTEESELPDANDPKLALCFPDLSRGRAQKWLADHGHPNGEGFGAVLTFLRRAGEATTSLPRSGRHRMKAGETSPVAWVELSPDLRAEFEGDKVREVNLDLNFSMEETVTYNIIGRLPGVGNAEHPELAQEAIVVSAHYDHIGEAKEEDADGDKIFNGADDDASGVATVLEIALALAAEGPQAREVLFLLATAEEIGILGTKYYLDHPSTPLERTVANLNFEMLGRPDEKAGGAGRLWLSGAERTNLMEAYADNALDIVADPYPEQNFFMRSDNIVFCYKGIVGQTFSSYNLHTDYHGVNDEVAGIDFEHMQSCARAGLKAVRMVADGTITPAWYEGGQPKPRRR